MSLTNEDKLLGVTKEQKAIQEAILTINTKFIVHTKGKNNYSILAGSIINRMLSNEAKEELLAGAKEIEYNGTIIEIKEEDKIQNIENMSFNELKNYCQDNDIDIKGLKSKVELLNAIKGA